VTQPSDYQLDPHLSLLYAPLPAAEREHLAATLTLLLAQIRFDELRLVAIPERNDSVSAIRSWQTLAACRLLGGDACQPDGTG